MGQYLAIGIANKINVRKSQVDKAQFSLEQLQEKMQQKLYFVPELYELQEIGERYIFNLKESILAEQLIPLLKTIYPLLYKRESDYYAVLQTLASLPPSEWLTWAETESDSCFQCSEYDDNERLRQDFSDIDIDYDCIVLSLEGKISMESCGQQFRFFKYTMQHAFREFALAGALRVYITG